MTQKPLVASTVGASSSPVGAGLHSCHMSDGLPANQRMVVGVPARTGYPPNIMLAKWHEMEIVCTKAQIKQILINHYR